MEQPPRPSIRRPLIARRTEGQTYRAWINWDRNESTRFTIVIVVPIGRQQYRYEYDIYTDKEEWFWVLPRVRFGFRWRSSKVGGKRLIWKWQVRR